MQRASSSYPLLNSLQIFRDVFFREAQRSTCAVTGQSFTSDLTHDCRAGDAATKLLYIFNGELRSLALKSRVNLQLVRCVRFHSLLVESRVRDFFETRNDEGTHWAWTLACLCCVFCLSFLTFGECDQIQL